MAALTRGPLPTSVYWRRRLVVLTVAVVVIWGLAHLLGGGGGQTPKAKSVADIGAAVTSPSPSPSGTASGDPSTSPTASATDTSSTTPTPTTSPTPAALPSPTGACAPSDVSVTPSVTNAAAGSEVSILLTLQTFNTPACTWQISHKTMQVKVTTAGGSDVWSTIQCKGALPTETVTLYQQQSTPVVVAWSSRLADATCDGHTDWAKAGAYQVTGVALGGQPDEASFDLDSPSAPPVAPPTPSSTPSAGSRSSGKPSTATSKTAKGSATPSNTPSAPAKKKHVIAD